MYCEGIFPNYPSSIPGFCLWHTSVSDVPTWKGLVGEQDHPPVTAQHLGVRLWGPKGFPKGT